MSDNKQVELVVVRHGKSTGNEKRQLQGHADTALSQEGREQVTIFFLSSFLGLFISLDRLVPAGPPGRGADGRD